MFTAWLMILGFILYWLVFALIFVHSDNFYLKFSKLFPKSLRSTITKYDDFNGKDTKKNFLFWIFFIFVFYVLTSILIIFGVPLLITSILQFTITLLLLFPTLAIFSRRLNENNYSRKYLFFLIIPFGFIIPTLLCLVNPRDISIDAKSGLIFDKPIYKDWVFVVWIVYSILSGMTAAGRVINEGGPYLTFASLISGTFDALTYPFIGFLLTALPLSVLRRIYRKFQK